MRVGRRIFISGEPRLYSCKNWVLGLLLLKGFNIKRIVIRKKETLKTILVLEEGCIIKRYYLRTMCSGLRISLYVDCRCEFLSRGGFWFIHGKIKFFRVKFYQ